MDITELNSVNEELLNEYDEFLEMRKKLSDIITPMIVQTQKLYGEEFHYHANMVCIGIDISCYNMAACIESGLVAEDKAIEMTIKDLKKTLQKYLEVFREHNEGIENDETDNLHV